MKDLLTKFVAQYCKSSAIFFPFKKSMVVPRLGSVSPRRVGGGGEYNFPSDINKPLFKYRRNAIVKLRVPINISMDALRFGMQVLCAIQTFLTEIEYSK